MTPEKQNLIIATACGWVPLEFDRCDPVKDAWFNPIGERVLRGINLGQMRTGIPDYTNDLNAMHEAEKTLTQDQCWLFQEHLSLLTFDAVKHCSNPPATRWLWSTTAGQRAEAFIKAVCKDKWE